MNGEEEGVSVVTHPPLEDQPPEEVKRESVNASNDSELDRDSIATEEKGEDEDVEEKDGLIGGVEDSAVVEKDEELREGVSIEEQGSGEEIAAVKEVSPKGDGEIAVEIEKVEEEAPEVQQSCPIGEEGEKLKGGDTDQVDESNVEEVDAQYNDNDDALMPLALHDGDMTMKEDKTGNLEAEIEGLEDSKIELEEMKNEEEDEKQIELEEEGGEGQELEKVTKVEVNKEEAEVEVNNEEKMEDKEMQADCEKEEAEKVTEEEEKQEVETNVEKETDGEKNQEDAKDDDEMLVGEENEIEKETEEEEEKQEVETKTEEEIDGEKSEADAKDDEEMLVGEENEVEKETEEEEEEANKGTEIEEKPEEDEEMHEVDEKDKVTEIEANKEDEERRADTMEDEEERELEGEANKETEDEDEREVEGDTNKETEDEEEREVNVDEEKETEDDERVQSPKSGSVKRNRGRNSKVAGRAPSKKTVREDVCFICLDGGELVFCDRRGCHKGYHLSCAEHDKSLNQTNGRWNCGWHLCNLCKKSACFMCYTCQFALCKGCAKGDAVFICVRGNKGLCETCMGSVMLIETNEENDGMDEATVDDKSRKNNLFKDYWTEQKERLSLTLDEIAQAKNRWMKGMPTDILVGTPNVGIASEVHLGSAESTDSKKNKPKKRVRPSIKDVDYDEDYSSGSVAKKKGKRGLKSLPKEDNDSDNSSKDNVVTRARKAKKSAKSHVYEADSAIPSGAEWASKELLEFVIHMKDGDKSPLSQYDVQELLLEYIQRNKLRDPRRKSQIVCDAMLQRLFGKQRVGHFEMLKLLELHFLLKEDSQADDNHGSVVDAEGSQLDVDENADSVVDLGKNKGRKSRRKGDGRGLQSNLDDYAAIDTHNITLIYLRRNLIEALLEDSEGFHDKVVGAFVRIRISGSNQKNDIYRLVQVTGTNKAEPYKVGKRIAYCMLEILNLNKTEVVSIDTISNQDFTEDECKRLRQSIKCGLISRLTVGDVLDKAKDLQVVRVIDWLETESTRLNHLRDRASDLGRKKELRECVEKLQLLSTPEERQRRLDEIPEVHADPNMDPSHESEDESEPEEKRQDINVRPRETPFPWREREHYSSRKGDYASTDPWSPTERPPARNWESSRSLSGKGFSSRLEDTSAPEEAFHGHPWSPVRDKVTSHSTSIETFRTTPDSSRGKSGQYSEMRNNASALSDTSRHPSASLAQTPAKISDSEKLWHYKDPSGKDQGPFSVTQLRKWNKSGYFPATLHIWKTGQGEEDAIFLTEALAGRFERLPSQMVRKSYESSPAHQTYRGQAPGVLKVDQNSTRDSFDRMSPVMHRSRSDTSKLSSPNLSSTPLSQRSGSSWSGRSKVSRWSGSPTPIQPPSAPSGSPGTGGMLPSPTPTSSRTAVASNNSPLYDNNQGGFSRSHLSQPRSREDDRYTQQLQPQPMMHQAQQQQPLPPPPPPPQPIAETINTTAVQPGNGQNLDASAQGWGSGGYMQNPTQLQGQQAAQYSQWTNAPPANNLPPPPPPSYGQNPSWTPQAPANQPNMQWAAAPDNRAVPAPQYPTNPGPAWAPPMQQPNPNVGWAAPFAPMPAGPPNVIQTPAGQNMNMGWQQSGGNMNPGWGPPQPTNTGGPGPGPGPWNWQQQQGGAAGMGPPGRPMRRKNNMPCPFFMHGHCKKGGNCDYRHN